MRLFIFASNARSTRYGVGSYLRVLIGVLSGCPDMQIYEVRYHSGNVIQFQEEIVSASYTRLLIPEPMAADSVWSEESERIYAEVVYYFLRPYTTEGPIVFQLNDGTALAIAQMLRQHYTWPVLAVVHTTCIQFVYKGALDSFAIPCNEQTEDDAAYTVQLEKHYYEQMHGIVSVTRHMKDFLRSVYHLSPKLFTVIPNGMDFKARQPLSKSDKLLRKQRLGFQCVENILLYVGRLDEGKGLTHLLSAFSALSGRYPDWHLVLIGEGDFQMFMNYAHDKPGRISFIGYVPSDVLECFYEVADMGILPSLYDYCPYSLLEMIDYDIPIIITDIPGPTEVLSPAMCKIIPMSVFKGRKQPLSVDFMRVLKDGYLDEKWRNSTHSRYAMLKRKHNDRRMRDAYVSVYNRLIDEMSS